MKFAYFSLAAILAALVLGASLSLPASAATDLHASAVHACTIANASQPVDFVAEVDDGRGGSLVWLTDADANLWLCNADADGQIFAYSKMTGDLLLGAGANLVGIEPVVNGEVGMPEKNPLTIAEKACQAYLSDWPRQGRGLGPRWPRWGLGPRLLRVHRYRQWPRAVRCHGGRAGLELRRDRRPAQPRQSGRLSHLV